MSDTLRISGKKFKLPADAAKAKDVRFEVRPGGWIIATFADGRRERFAMMEGKGKLSLALQGRLGFGDISAERKHGAGAASGGGDADLTAQFPGKVRKILVAAGATVAAGDPLILVEAMKMEFTVKSPFAGKVDKVLVSEGQQLSPGDHFFDITEAANGNGDGGSK